MTGNPDGVARARSGGHAPRIAGPARSTVGGTAMRMMAGDGWRLVTVGLAAWLAAGCADSPATASERPGGLALPERDVALSGMPAVDIGMVEGDPAYLLHHAVSSVRLGDGRIVVLNAGSHELRFYDDRGNHVGNAGGKGDGPGEFRRPARVHLAHGDTLVVFDPGADRESVFDTRGVFVRTVSAVDPESEPFPRDAWLWGRAYIDGPRDTEDRDAVRAVLEALPAAQPGASIRFVRVDEHRRVWVRREPDDGVNAQWDVWSVDGTPLVRVTMPASFEPQHIGPDFLLGRSLDAMNVEHIRLYQVRDLPVPDARREPTAARTAMARAPARQPSADALAQVRGVLRNMMMQQEIFYSKPAHGYRYASRVDQLAWPDDTTGLVIRILDAGATGWSAVIYHEGEDIICGVTTGVGGPVGWRPGIVHCS